MKISNSLSEPAVLEELGSRLALMRVQKNISQAQLALETGLAKRTIEYIESGRRASTSTFIRILRVLGILDRLDLVLPDSEPSPMEVLRSQGKRRKRASSRGIKSKESVSWKWKEDR